MKAAVAILALTLGGCHLDGLKVGVHDLEVLLCAGGAEANGVRLLRDGRGGRAAGQREDGGGGLHAASILTHSPAASSHSYSSPSCGIGTGAFHWQVASSSTHDGYGLGGMKASRKAS